MSYLNRTFGILILNGEEKLFAIDGQHRTKAIKDALKEKPSIKEEEVAVIFIAHSESDEGLIRTRRLFSTLNDMLNLLAKVKLLRLMKKIIVRLLLEI